MSADFNQDKGILIYVSSVIDKDGAELHFTYHFCLSPEDTVVSLYWHFVSLFNFCIWKLIKFCPQWEPCELFFSFKGLLEDIIWYHMAQKPWAKMLGIYTSFPSLGAGLFQASLTNSLDMMWGEKKKKKDNKYLNQTKTRTNLKPVFQL